MNRDERERTPAPDRLQHVARLVERHAELVDLEAGRNVRMALRVDVGVDAHRHTCRPPEPRCDRLDAGELPRRLDVDRLHAERDRGLEFRHRLADAGKHDIGRLKPGFPRDLDFPHRVRVGLAAQLAQQARNRQRRIGLECVVECVRIAAEGLVDGPVPRSQRGRAVDVHGRAKGGGDGRQRHAVADERVLLSEEAGRCRQRGTLFYSILHDPGLAGRHRNAH